MRVGGYGSSAAFRRNSDTLGTVSECQGGVGPRFEYVAIGDMREAMLSSLRDEDKFSLLATYLLSVRRLQGSIRVRYGRLGRVRSIIVNGTEYQEQGGRVQGYKFG